MNTIEYNGVVYPELQSKGFAAQYAFPFAKQVLTGEGFDIGCNRKEWAYPGAQMIDLVFNDEFDAFNLPNKKVDYIFSSHCLEHLNDWVGALDHWTTRLHKGGIIFLYLPHPNQIYWKPWNNRKHIHILEPKHIRDYFTAKNFTNVFVTEGFDLNHSFYAVAEY
tara:strand:+ start:3237 stop:3728 length:492 start_codon:yes stop_codon:yes gene_type:complete